MAADHSAESKPLREETRGLGQLAGWLLLLASALTMPQVMSNTHHSPFETKDAKGFTEIAVLLGGASVALIKKEPLPLWMIYFLLPLLAIFIAVHLVALVRHATPYEAVETAVLATLWMALGVYCIRRRHEKRRALEGKTEAS